jgi:hypothetical protein
MFDASIPVMAGLARVRDELGVSGEELAAVLDLQPVGVTRLESSADPLLSSVHRFAHGLGEASGRVVSAHVVINIGDPAARPVNRRFGGVIEAGGDRAIRIRAWGDADLEARCVHEGFVVMGGDEVGDMTVWPGRDQLAVTLTAHLRGRDSQAIKLFCTYWDRFLRYMRIGDVVALPSKATRTVAIGRVVGPYEFHQVEGGDDRIWHRRAVKWIVADLDWDLLDDDLRRGVNAPGTIGALNAPAAAHRLLDAAKAA